MQVSHQRWCANNGWQGNALADADLILTFGGDGDFDAAPALTSLRNAHADARLIGCSTAGEIFGMEVSDATLSAIALKFNATPIDVQWVKVEDFPCSAAAGAQLARQLSPDGLKHVLVMSPMGSASTAVNSPGACGKILPTGVPVTGGLAGDADRFGRTQVYVDDLISTGIIACVGFYGDAITTGYGSLGGWDVFGPDRIITRSEGNVLYELDGESALALYKQYLGDYAEDLPGSGLLFPLNIQSEHEDERVVRTILGVDEDAQSLIFAGDMPQGARAQLMRANFDRLIDGATGAATICQNQDDTPEQWQFALLVSCVGRRMVLGQRVEEELEGVCEVLGEQVPLIGFYSYGELAPFVKGDTCRLHNQTMTITTFAEVVKCTGFFGVRSGNTWANSGRTMKRWQTFCLR